MTSDQGTGIESDDVLTTGLEPKEPVREPYATIHVEVHPERATRTIILDRPKTYNAFNFQMMDEIAHALDMARFDNGTKVVVIRAEGPHFSSGHDMNELAMLHRPSARLGLAERINRDRRRAGESWESIARFNKPIVCRVQGKAIGAGAQLALLADVTVVADDAEITMSPLRFGGPVQDALLPLWILNAGLKRSRFLLFTGAGIDGPTAVEYGVATRATPEAKLDEAVEQIVGAIAMLPLDGLVLSKEWLNLQLGMMGVMPGFLPGYLGHAFFSNIQYREGEFNFLREVKNQGMAEAYRARDARFDTLLEDW